MVLTALFRRLSSIVFQVYCFLFSPYTEFVFSCLLDIFSSHIICVEKIWQLLLSLYTFDESKIFYYRLLLFAFRYYFTDFNVTVPFLFSDIFSFFQICFYLKDFIGREGETEASICYLIPHGCST